MSSPAASPGGPLRLIFFGTPEFAVPSLEALVRSRHEVVGVISQPDRPRGRGRKLEPTPVSRAAAAHALPVLQPEKVGDSEALAWQRDLHPDLGCVVAFGQFIPRKVRDLPPHGLINAHASLLPAWRGAAPIAHAILAGEARTGVTIIRVAREMDAGDWCAMRELEIRPGETTGELEVRLAELAAGLLVQATDQIANGTARFAEQAHDRATLAPKLERDFGRVDPSETAARTLDRIRAATPRPGADLALVGGDRMRILAARLVPLDEGLPPEPGRIRASDARLLVGALDGWVEVLRLQVPGKRPVAAADYLRGASIPPDAEVLPP